MDADRLLDELLAAEGIGDSLRTSQRDQSEFSAARLVSSFTLYNITVSAASETTLGFGYETEGTPQGADRLLHELLDTAGIHEFVRTIPHDPQHEFAAARVLYDGTLYNVDARVAPDERIPRSEDPTRAAT